MDARLIGVQPIWEAVKNCKVARGVEVMLLLQPPLLLYEGGKYAEFDIGISVSL